MKTEILFHSSFNLTFFFYFVSFDEIFILLLIRAMFYGNSETEFSRSLGRVLHEGCQWKQREIRTRKRLEYSGLPSPTLPKFGRERPRPVHKFCHPCSSSPVPVVYKPYLLVFSLEILGKTYFLVSIIAHWKTHSCNYNSWQFHFHYFPFSALSLKWKFKASSLQFDMKMSIKITVCQEKGNYNFRL